MADTKISALSAGAAIGGTEQIPAVQSGGNVYFTPEQLKSEDQLLAASRWYWPPLLTQSAGTGLAANTMKFYPVYFPKRVTISDLGVRIVTGVASSHLKLTMYAANATTGAPTGNALGNCVIDTSQAAGAYSGTLSANIVITPGWWWFASHSDSTPTINALSTAPGGVSSVYGATALANLSTGSGAAHGGYVFNATYASGLPDMTSNTLSDVGASGVVPAIAYKVTSVP